MHFFDEVDSVDIDSDSFEGHYNLDFVDKILDFEIVSEEIPYSYLEDIAVD